MFPEMHFACSSISAISETVWLLLARELGVSVLTDREFNLLLRGGGGGMFRVEVITAREFSLP
jgi:hypothetical protein